MLAVGFSVVVPQERIDFLNPLQIIFCFLQEPLILFCSSLVFTSTFILHELAHKIVANHYGFEAEFRLVNLGVLLTFFSVICPIKLVSPGWVVIEGAWYEKAEKITLAGPAANIVFSILFLTASFVLKGGAFSLIMKWGAILNSWIALFNLIPISFLDGKTIFKCERVIWGLFFSASIILMICSTTLILLLIY